ncbi:hypothetical protein PsorP6_011360 [Peronosclerospora sorghi]|uniref:Uncharacterized protein n=1 Tax=Peronosclerospora sorghi TaxID=230839 RepID=A0ACC0WIK4_9STRA|nr:hypothetical protein PsorP6_011360 [Peronosclerospora sorghi]
MVLGSIRDHVDINTPTEHTQHTIGRIIFKLRRSTVTPTSNATITVLVGEVLSFFGSLTAYCSSIGPHNATEMVTSFVAIEPAGSSYYALKKLQILPRTRTR